MFNFSWDNFLLLHLVLPSPSSLLDLYKGVFLQAKNTFFWPMKEKKNGKTAHVFLWVNAVIFQSPLSVASTNDVTVAWSGMWQELRYVHLTWPLGEQCLHFYSLKWFLFYVTCKLGYLWYCHFTDALYFPAANLRCGNDDLELHFPSVRAELCNFACQICKWRLSYYCLAWFKRYHRGRLYASCHADEKRASLAMFTKASCLKGKTVWKRCWKSWMGQLRKRKAESRALSLECLHLPGSWAFKHQRVVLIMVLYRLQSTCTNYHLNSFNKHSSPAR